MVVCRVSAKSGNAGKNQGNELCLKNISEKLCNSVNARAVLFK